MAGRGRILQVFSTLIGNSVKFTPEGGTVSIEVVPLDGEVQFAVSDTGPGIPAPEREHVFDRYWQAKAARRAGAGLGLFIVKGIVEAHGGRVWVEAVAPHGTCICFTLPRSAPRERPAELA